MIDAATLDLIERIDVYAEGIDEDTPSVESQYALSESLAGLQLKLAQLADARDPAGNTQAAGIAADFPPED